MTFEAPYLFYLLLILPLLAICQILHRRRQAISYSSIELFSHTEKTWRQRLLFLPPLCLHAALTCLIIALARPMQEVTNQRQEREGIAIEILIDISSSMDINMTYGDKEESRMEVAKKVVESFISGDGDSLKGRPNDLIGVISFARYADTICPLTLGHDAAVYMVRSLKINERPNEDGTNYGDATALAAARLESLESEKGGDIKSKIIILLTDGENNTGNFAPDKSAAKAKEWGIKVYTISIQDLPRMESRQTDKGEFFVPAEVPASDLMLEKMADITGGIFRRAHDFDSLQAVYEEINRLEKSKLKAVDYSDHTPAFHFFVLAAIILLIIKYALSATILRVAP